MLGGETFILLLRCPGKELCKWVELGSGSGPEMAHQLAMTLEGEMQCVHSLSLGKELFKLVELHSGWDRVLRVGRAILGTSS